jgi:hypothetical protein
MTDAVCRSVNHVSSRFFGGESYLKLYGLCTIARPVVCHGLQGLQGLFCCFP